MLDETHILAFKGLSIYDKIQRKHNESNTDLIQKANSMELGREMLSVYLAVKCPQNIEKQEVIDNIGKLEGVFSVEEVV